MRFLRRKLNSPHKRSVRLRTWSYFSSIESDTDSSVTSLKNRSERPPLVTLLQRFRLWDAGTGQTIVTSPPFLPILRIDPSLELSANEGGCPRFLEVAMGNAAYLYLLDCSSPAKRDSRNVAFCPRKELTAYRDDRFSSVIWFRRVGDCFLLSFHSGIIAKVTGRTTSWFVNATNTEVSSENGLENRNQPSDRRGNRNVFVTDGEACRLKRSE